MERTTGMRVPVVDSQQTPLAPCSIGKARALIQREKAILRYDADGGIFLQLVHPANGRHPRAPVVAPVGVRSRKLRRKLGRALLVKMADVLARANGTTKERCMGGILDRLIVVDVEATCWEHDPPDGQEAEIIEIGVCALDLDGGERLAGESILVRPERSAVSPFCTALTTLTPDQVAGGVSFAEACARLRADYGTHERVWASYGDYDRRQFERQCATQGVPYPFGPTHVNIKNLLALFAGLRREVGLLEAMALLDLPAEGTHHRGVDDAWNAALVLSTLIGRRRAELGA